MKNFVIDLHTDIATNVLEATGKDITREYGLHEGTPSLPGLVANNNVDIPRLKKGGVNLVFTSLFGLDQKSFDELLAIEQSEYNFNKLKEMTFGLEAALEQLSYYYGVFMKAGTSISLVTSKKDYIALKNNGKIGFLIHLEGMDYVDGDYKILDALYNLGVRSCALTWRNRNLFASGNNVDGGLTPLGKRLIRKISKMGMVFDLAHTNEKTFWDIIKIIDFPPVVSHTLCYAICPNSRNLKDSQIKAVAKLGGVIGMAAIPDYIGGETLEDYVKHFEHIINIAGDDFVAFGTDFDGLTGADDRFMEGFTGSDGFPNVIRVFRKRGFSRETIEKICYKNIERILFNRLF